MRGPYADIFDFCRRADPGAINKRACEALIKAGCFDGLGGNRVQCMQVYEPVLDADARSRRNNHKNQLSLFDAALDSATSGTERAYPDLKEYPRHALLAMEKEVTGIYISGHPLDAFADELGRLEWTSGALEELAEREDRGQPEDGRYVEMGGLAVGVKQKATRNGGLMAFVTLEDLTGQVECLFFPRVWDQWNSLIRQDEPYVFSGRLSIPEERTPSLVVESVRPLGRAAAREAPRDPALIAKQAPSKLYLQISRSQMEQCGAVLRRFPGDVPVFIHLKEEGQTLLAPRDWWVGDALDARADLLTILGKEQVKVVNKKA